MKGSTLCQIAVIGSLTMLPTRGGTSDIRERESEDRKDAIASTLTLQDILRISEFQEVQLSPDGRRLAYTIRRPRLESNDHEHVGYVRELGPSSTDAKVFVEGRISNLRWRPDSMTLTYLDSDRRTIRAVGATTIAAGGEAPTVKAADPERIAAFEWNRRGDLVAYLSSTQTTSNAVRYLLQPDHYCSGRCRPTGSGGGSLSVVRANGHHVCRANVENDEQPYGITWVSNGRSVAVLTRKADAKQGQLTYSASIFALDKGVCTRVYRLPNIGQIADGPSEGALYGVAVPHNVDIDGTFVFTTNRSAVDKIELGTDGRVRRTEVARLSAPRAGDPPDEIRYLAATPGGLFVETRGRTMSTIFKLDATWTNGIVPVGAGKTHLSKCSFSRTGQLAACVRQGLEEAPELATIHVGTGDMRDVTQEHSWLKVKTLGRIKEVQIVDGLARPVTMFVVHPVDYKSTKRYPAIIVLYGFDRSFVAQAQSITSYAPQVYAARGVVTLLWNFPAFIKAKIGDGAAQAHSFQENQTAAILEARKWLVESGLANPARIGIAGHSMGSTWMDYALIRHAGQFRAAASHSPAGYSGARTYWEWSAWYRTRLRHIFGGTPYETPADWQRLAPARTVPPIVPQLREINESDIGVELEFRERGEEGGPAELWVYPDEEHVFSSPRGRLASLELNLDWFEFWLSNREDLAAHKTDQYARWRRYRGNDSTHRANPQ